MSTFDKLQKLFGKQGLVVKCVYTIDKQCVYIELMNISTSTAFLVYIPSAYTIKPSHDVIRRKIKSIELDMSNHIATDYSSDMVNMDTMYQEIDLDDREGEGEGDIVKKLEQSYDRQIDITDSKQVASVLKDYYRQLNRIKLCVKHLKYKIAIKHGSYICVINRHDDIDCYYINKGETKDLDQGKGALMYGVVDLDYYTENIANAEAELKEVKKGVCNVIDKTQDRHAKRLSGLITDNLLNVKSVIDIYKAKNKYVDYITRLEELLTKVCLSEQAEMTIIADIKEKNSSRYLSDDISRTHEVARHEKELDRLDKIKQDVIINLLQARTKHDDMSLFVDRLMFDNVVMLKVVMDNIAKIKKYLEV